MAATPRPSTTDLALYTRQLAAMVNAGIQIHRALRLLGEGPGPMARMSAQVSDLVGSGQTLSRSMAKFPTVFSPVYCGLIAMAETSGRVSAVLEHLSGLLETQDQLSRKFISTLTYPLVLLTVALLGTALFLFYTLPQMMPLYTSLGVTLPVATQSLILIKNLLPWLALSAATLATLAWLVAPYAIDRVRPETVIGLHLIPLRLPILGPAIEKAISSRILHAMSTMLEVGITIEVALEQAAGVAGNRYVGSRLLKARQALREGSSVWKALEDQEVLPRTAVAFLAAGEEAGEMPQAMRNAARMCDYEVDASLTTMAGLLEPLVMLLMGIMVGWIVLASVLPMVRIIDRL